MVIFQRHKQITPHLSFQEGFRRKVVVWDSFGNGKKDNINKTKADGEEEADLQIH